MVGGLMGIPVACGALINCVRAQSERLRHAKAKGIRILLLRNVLKGKACKSGFYEVSRCNVLNPQKQIVATAAPRALHARFPNQAPKLTVVEPVGVKNS